MAPSGTSLPVLMFSCFRLRVEQVRHGGCFNMWGERTGAAREWALSWGPPPTSNASMIATLDCGMKVLTWHPEYAGRYWSAPRAMRPTATGDAVLQTHDELIGTGGVGHEATPPFVLRTLYGGHRHVRVVATLRNPVDRIETAFWCAPYTLQHRPPPNAAPNVPPPATRRFHKQFWAQFSPTAAGFDAYAAEQVREFSRCEGTHGTRRCAFLFERLGPAQASAFWHCNQIIRGLYEPFVADWHAALGPTSLLVLRVESILDAPVTTARRLQHFLGLSERFQLGVAGDHAPLGYTARHAASLNVSCCGGVRGAPEPMWRSTRALLENFYAPHNRKLAARLGDAGFLRWVEE